MPRSYTPCYPPSVAPPEKENARPLFLSLSPVCLVSLSPVQSFMTPAPDCGRLKSLEVVSGSHLRLSSLCMLGGFWKKRKKKEDGGGVAEACGGEWVGVKGETSMT